MSLSYLNPATEPFEAAVRYDRELRVDRVRAHREDAADALKFAPRVGEAPQVSDLEADVAAVVIDGPGA